jgi:hypothetical protein
LSACGVLSRLATLAAIRGENIVSGYDELKLASLFLERFANRRDFYFMQRINLQEESFGYIKVGSVELTEKLVRLHLVGACTLSLPTASEDHLSKWICFDGDTEGGELFKIESVLKEMNLNPLREGRRPGKDGHLWLMLSEPVSATDAALFGRTIVEALGIDPADVEVYPKEIKGFGQMRLPLGKHRKPGANEAVGLFEECRDESVWEQVLWLERQSLSLVQPIDNVVSVIREKNRCQDYYKYHQAICNPFKQSESVCWLDILSNWKRTGSEYARQCPLCESEGRDKHHDNLGVSSDGLRINCVLGGPNAIHKTVDIYRYYGF